MIVPLPPVPGPLGPPSALPPVTIARLALTERWRIERVPAPRRERGGVKVRSLAVVVGGRRVVLGPREGFDYVDGVERGRDGSLLVHRADFRKGRAEWRDSVWYRGRETTVWGAQVYRDRNDYATYFVREEMPWLGDTPAPPLTPPEATGVRDGKPVALGWGWPKAWTPEGALVLQVPVDAAGQPSGFEFTEDKVTRIVSGAREWRVRGYRYLGRMDDGTIGLVSSRPYIYFSEWADGTLRDRVLLWRGGRFVAHVELPARWRVEGLSPAGWILARRSPPSKPLPPIPFVEGRKAEDIVRDLERDANSDDDPETRAERDWTAGVLKDGVLTPVTFPKPKGAERLLWQDGATEYGRRAFRFMAFWGDDERTFRVSAPG